MTTTDRPDINRSATDPAGSDRTPTGAEAHYVQLDWFTRNVFNPIVARLTRWGVSLWGSRVLSVPGRVSGEIRSTPVNLLDVDGRRYLVAPRGETHWVRNVRAGGSPTLRVGRRIEAVRLEELADDDKPAVLRPYLRRWKWEVGRFFGGVDADSTDAELIAIAPDHPVFEVHST